MVNKALRTSFRQFSFISNTGKLSFKLDGVHLAEVLAKKLFDTILENGKWLLEDRNAPGTEDSSSSKEQSQDKEMEIVHEDIQPRPNTSVTPSVQRGAKRKLLASSPGSSFASALDLQNLRTEMNSRQFTYLHVFARHQEELDKMKNKAMLNKIVINGLEIPDIWNKPRGLERDELFCGAVTELLDAVNKALQDDLRFKATIQFVRHLNNHMEKNKPPQQVVEVRFGNEKEAMSVRRAFGALTKAWTEKKATPADFAGIGMTACVTHETKVWVKILEAIARIIKDGTGPDVSAYVVQHVPRPLLKIVTTDQFKNLFTRSLFFIDAIQHVNSKYPGQLTDQELYDAYDFAGAKYGKEISHHFVVLKDRDYPAIHKPAQKAKGRGHGKGK